MKYANLTIVLTLAMTTACGGSGGLSNESDPAQTGPTSSDVGFEPGDRLQALSRVASDGTRFFDGWFDKQLGTTCSFVPTGTKYNVETKVTAVISRCLPDGKDGRMETGKSASKQVSVLCMGEPGNLSIQVYRPWQGPAGVWFMPHEVSSSKALGTCTSGSVSSHENVSYLKLTPRVGVLTASSTADLSPAQVLTQLEKPAQETLQYYCGQRTEQKQRVTAEPYDVVVLEADQFVSVSQELPSCSAPPMVGDGGTGEPEPE